MKQLELAFPTVKQRINRLESIMENAEPSERFGMLEIDEEQNDPKIVAYKPSTQLDFFGQLEEKEAEVISLADYKASKEPESHSVLVVELTPRSLDQTIPSVIPSIPSPPLSDLIYQESIETKFNKENNISFVTRIVAIYQLSD